MPPFQDRDTTLRMLLAEVKVLSVVLSGRSSEAECERDKLEATGANPVVRTIAFTTVLRTEHDSAKIAGGGSNPPGGTTVLLRRGLGNRVGLQIRPSVGFNS